jgi:hypothetical protein
VGSETVKSNGSMVDENVNYGRASRNKESASARQVHPKRKLSNYRNFHLTIFLSTELVGHQGLQRVSIQMEERPAVRQRSFRNGIYCDYKSSVKDTDICACFPKVFQALLSTGAIIAVKEVEMEEADPQRARKDYENVKEEVNILRGLDHVNVVK